MRTFLPKRKAVQKPPLQKYNSNPETLGEHIRKVRIERNLSQKHVGSIFGLCKDTVTCWENGRSRPQLQHYPRIIRFLGYYPFGHETETLGGKLRQIRYCSGFSYRQCAKYFKVSPDAAQRWESGSPILSRKLRAIIEAVWEELIEQIPQHPF